MKRLVVADSHLGQREGDAQLMGLVLARAMDAGIGEVVYLGDAFQYLIGMSKFWTATVLQVMHEWQKARAAGLRLVLVEGNRDFFLDESELLQEVDWTGMEYHFEAADRRFLLVHGDRVNRRDFQYRFWASVSKSGLARTWARLLPRTTAVRIVEGMERRLAATNRKWRYRIPADELRHSAEQAWARGIDVVLWGHFHAAWACRDDQHEARVLPAWLDRNLAMMIDADGSTTMVDGNLEPVAEAAARDTPSPQ